MKKLLSLTALCAFGMTANAADPSPFYGSLGGGLYRIDSGEFSESAATAKLLGGYELNRHFAVEGGYTRLFEASERIGGAIEGVDLNVDGHAWDLSLRAGMPFGERLYPYARMGWSYTDLNGEASAFGETERFNDYHDAFVWAVGTSVNLNRRLALNGEVARTNLDGGDLDFLSLTMNYRFGRS